MRYSSMIPYIVGCIGLFTVCAALAKDPPQPLGASTSAVTPAGCVDSPRGRTHVLRLCGDKHHWFKVKAATLPDTPLPTWVGAAVVSTSVSIDLNR